MVLEVKVAGDEKRVEEEEEEGADLLTILFFTVVTPGIYPLAFIVKQIRDYAESLMYDPEKISDQIKMNRMMYEFGEISKEEYERTRDDLMHKLRIVQRGRAMGIDQKMDRLAFGETVELGTEES